MASDFLDVSVTPYEQRTDSVIAVPAAVAEDDILVLVQALATTGTPPIPTLPEDFQLLDGAFPVVLSDDDVTLHLYIAWKRATAEEPENYTIGHAQAVAQTMLIAFTGADPLLDPLLTINQGIGSTSTALSITPPRNNSVVAFIALSWQGYSGAADPPTGTTPTFTERVDDISAVSVLYLATGVLGTAQPTGAKSHANGNAGPDDPWAAFLLTVPAEAVVTGFKAAWAASSNVMIQ